MGLVENMGMCQVLSLTWFLKHGVHNVLRLTGLGFKGLGFKGLGFKGLGLKGLGFRDIPEIWSS